MQNGKPKSKKIAGCDKKNAPFSLRTSCVILNLCTIGILLCERSFDDSAVTFCRRRKFILHSNFQAELFRDFTQGIKVGKALDSMAFRA